MKRPHSGPDDPRNPYGVSRPLDRMAMILIGLATDVWPSDETMAEIEAENHQMRLGVRDDYPRSIR